MLGNLDCCIIGNEISDELARPDSVSVKSPKVFLSEIIEEKFYGLANIVWPCKTDYRIAKTSGRYAIPLGTKVIVGTIRREMCDVHEY